MTRLLLVKHSLVEIDETVPAREWILSNEGRERARRLAKKLSSYKPEAIVSSVEPKARQTAEIIAKECGVNVHAVDDLREHERSHVPFLQRDKFETFVKEFFEKPDSLVFGDETATRALARFQRRLMRLSKLRTRISLLLFRTALLFHYLLPPSLGVMASCSGRNWNYPLASF